MDKVQDKSIDDYNSIVTLPRSTMIRMRIRYVDAVLIRRRKLLGREGVRGGGGRREEVDGIHFL